MSNDQIIRTGRDYIKVRILNEGISRSKPPVVFLHDGLGSIDQWKDFPKKLATSLQVTAILYDRIGYGGSSQVQTRNKSYLHKEADYFLPAVLDFFNIDSPVHLFGHSDGATIALLFAAMHPRRSLKVIAAAPHVIIEPETVVGVKDAIEAFHHGGLKAKLRKFHGPKTDSMFEVWSGFWIRESSSSWNMLDWLPKVNSPVLYIQGDKDNFGTLKQGEIIQETISGRFEQMIISDCGHFPHIEKPEIVLERSIAFFAGSPISSSQK
jgi:pimeloyl-ACP methyl ester carboxylesterase